MAEDRKKRSPELGRTSRLLEILRANGVAKYKEAGFEVEFRPAPVDLDAIGRLVDAAQAGAADAGGLPKSEAAWAKSRRRLAEDEAS